MTILKWLIVLLLVGYLGGVAVLFFRQREFVFPIPPVGRTSPPAAGFPQAEEHVLTSADGKKVIVWHVPAKPGHPVVLFFHGNGDTLAGLVGRFRGITADGTGLVALSYRGYAGSSGQPSEPGLLLDAAAAYAFTAARYKTDQIVVWGFSLGTGVAVALAAVWCRCAG
jgi:alpha-beta hydrolase superfamily lysophospholipase